MQMKNFSKTGIGLLILTMGWSSPEFSFAGIEGNGPRKTQKLSKGAEYVNFNSLDINDIRVYFQNNGNVQDPTGNWAVEYPRDKSAKPTANPTKTAIFAAGFALSGYVKGDLRASWMASASRVEDWQPGNLDKSGKPANSDNTEFKVYKYTKTDKLDGINDIKTWPVQYGAPWMDKNGVMQVYNGLPADYNGTYNPAAGDRPYLYGDQMVWYVINDMVDEANTNRRFKTKGMGIEAQVNAFAFNQSNALANGFFVIYKFINRGKDDVENVIFSVWSDPDLGNSDDDLVGVDSVRSLAYIYNEGNTDTKYGTPPPVAGYDFFLGPKVPRTKVVGNQTVPDSNYVVNILGKKYYGFEQLQMNSFVKYVRDRADLPDPNTATEARNYQEGKKFNGALFNPLTDGNGGKATDNPYIVHPGYPETGLGWVDNQGGDRRMMINTKPFTLAKGDTQVIVVGYMVGTGSDNKDGVKKLREIDDILQKVFGLNFVIAGPPPAPETLTARIDESGKINLTFPTAPSMKYDFDDGLTRKVFKGFRINQYKNGSTEDVVDGVVNKKELLLIDVNDGYDIVYDRKESGASTLVFDSDKKFENESIFLKPDAQFNFTVPLDKFTDFPFIQGKTYTFSVSSIGIDIKNIAPIYDKANKLVAWGSDSPIIESGETIVQIVYNGITGNSFAVEDSSKYVTQVAGNGGGIVLVDVLDNTNLVSDRGFTVGFFNDGYDKLLWNLKDAKSDTLMSYKVPGLTALGKDTLLTVKVDSLDIYSKERFLRPINGLSIRVKKPAPEVLSAKFKSGETLPVVAMSTKTGVAVLSKDASSVGGLIKKTAVLPVTSSVKHDNVKSVLIDFSDSSYAFRYVSGFQVAKYFTNLVKNVPEKVLITDKEVDSIGWAGYSALLATATESTPGTFASGRWKAARKPGVGVTKVPFKVFDISTDPANPRQLTIGFIERFIPDKDGDTLQYLDGQWNPLGNYNLAPEMILVSSDTYDPNVKQTEKDTSFYRNYKDFLIRNNSFISPWILSIEANLNATSVTTDKKIEITTNVLSSSDKFLITSPKNQADSYNADINSKFNRVTIYPNPYMGDNPAEVSNVSRFVSIGNLPHKATIRIYNLAGQLVRKLEKDDITNITTWDLKNLTGLYVASGVYLIHIESPGLGSKVLKFALIQRQERIDTY
ncbi:MAG: T9SS type A sorting domain-containing protein [Bacteroidetes bacterium]|nr:T9SS type A sorting domain-containing protein [Bacteroidota bacterium]